LMDTLIKNATIINEGKIFEGSVFLRDDLIDKIYLPGEQLPDHADKIINLEKDYLIPGVIDDQVHFREPGMTHKADIQTESAAAVAGGVTSFMEMPNTNPQTISIEALNDKFERAAKTSYANYSFYLGATNDNLDELLKADPATTCGIKVFMGSSTGNMLVDNKKALENIFREVPLQIATHCEDEPTVRQNSERYRQKYGEEIPVRFHPLIRSAEACYRSSSLAVELASKHQSRLHILHLSTKKELELLNNQLPLTDKKITGEVCVHHLWFSDADYDKYGSRIKWNPAIKTAEDREALREGLQNNYLDVIATDHAPHTFEEKSSNSYFKTPAGGPLVEHSLMAMFELTNEGVFSKEMIIEKMCHAPARLFQIERRGFIREGYYADLAVISRKPLTVDDKTVHYKCKWSPFSGTTFQNRVTHTFINGHLAFEKGQINPQKNGRKLVFNR
ncbi:MAG: dihydroorotase, partial [Marinilabiliaceae bacterium]